MAAEFNLYKAINEYTTIFDTPESNMTPLPPYNLVAEGKRSIDVLDGADTIDPGMLLEQGVIDVEKGICQGCDTHSLYLPSQDHHQEQTETSIDRAECGWPYAEGTTGGLPDLANKVYVLLTLYSLSVATMGFLDRG